MLAGTVAAAELPDLLARRKVAGCQLRRSRKRKEKEVLGKGDTSVFQQDARAFNQENTSDGFRSSCLEHELLRC